MHRTLLSGTLGLSMQYILNNFAFVPTVGHHYGWPLTFDLWPKYQTARPHGFPRDRGKLPQSFVILWTLVTPLTSFPIEIKVIGHSRSHFPAQSVETLHVCRFCFHFGFSHDEPLFVICKNGYWYLDKNWRLLTFVSTVVQIFIHNI